MLLAYPTLIPTARLAVPRILLVEDDSTVRELLLKILEHAGYPCTSVADSHAALALSDQDLSRIDLLVTDIMIPGLDGPALSVRLRERHPDLQVLLISAWLRPGESRVPRNQLLPKSRRGQGGPGRPSAPDATGLDLLPKPFGFHELLERVGMVLKS